MTCFVPKNWVTLIAGSALFGLVGCGNGFDIDLRGLGPSGFGTAQAARNAPPRPLPDSRGLISYPNYQVAVARPGDTVATIAGRLGLRATDLATYNAIDPNVPLGEGAIVALPRTVAAGQAVASGSVVDPFAGQGTKKPDVPGLEQKSSTARVGPEPRRHIVSSGETVWSISRKYGLTVQDLTDWNGMSADTSLRVGQTLLIPATAVASKPSSSTEAPGSGSKAPPPPSATDPLPSEKTVPLSQTVAAPEGPDLGRTRSDASGNQRLQMPVTGAIIQTYAKGKNDGIDISAPTGTPVKAAASGVVAAITKDTMGMPIIVIRHNDGLLTVYTGVTNLSVSNGDKVSTGTKLASAGSKGFVHFEVREGFESRDPEKYLR